jgi:hypothetical protein
MLSNLITYYRLIAGRPLPPLTAAHHIYLGVRSVPIAASRDVFFSVRLQENRYSELAQVMGHPPALDTLLPWIAGFRHSQRK